MQFFRCKITIKIPHTQKNFKIICTIQKKAVLLQPISKERWQSGRLRRSWKPLSWEAPGVRIPLSPQAESSGNRVKQKWVERSISTFFVYSSLRWKLACISGVLCAKRRRQVCFCFHLVGRAERLPRMLLARQGVRGGLAQRGRCPRIPLVI